MIYGIQLFWIGFHNIDVCHNEKVIALTLDVDIKETKIDSGELWSLDDCYLSGLKTLIYGFYVSMLGSFLVGYLLKR